MLKIREALDIEGELIRELRLKAYEEHANNISEEHWDALRTCLLNTGVIENILKYIIV